MIQATLDEVLAAHKALRRINEEVRLPQKPAWRVATLLRKMKPILRQFTEVQQKFWTDAGAVERNGTYEIRNPDRKEDETVVQYEQRTAEYDARVAELNAKIKAQGEETVEIDYDPLKLSLFDEPENTPAEKRMKFSANDLADAGPFLVE